MGTRGYFRYVLIAVVLIMAWRAVGTRMLR
jgi:hypothetical protein